MPYTSIMTDQPNWLLVSFDQWRGDWFHQPWLQIPQLKSFASTAWQPNSCITASPQCVPARASWLTGLWPSQLGITRNCDHKLLPDSPSFVRRLQENGWYTSLVGKTHWHPHSRGVDLRDSSLLLKDLGFDEFIEVAGPKALCEVSCDLTDDWINYQPSLLDLYRLDLRERHENKLLVKPSILPTHLYPDIWVANKSISQLSQLAKLSQPWFLWVSFPGPHEPWDTPEPWSFIHQEYQIPPAAGCPGWVYSQPKHSEYYLRQQEWDYKLAHDNFDEVRIDYANHMALLDSQFGRLLDALPQSDQTVISVVSDHGELLGDSNLLYKGCFLEGAIRSLALHSSHSLSPEFPRPAVIGLTDFLHSVSSSLINCSDPSVDFNRFTFSEFGSELLVTDGNYKLTVDASNNPLWATSLAVDPLEQINQLEANDLSSFPLAEFLRAAAAHRTYCADTP